MQTIQRHFAIRPGAEITLEVNPDDACREKLAGYKGWGINRLSIGVQSFKDTTLHSLHRSHTAAAAIQGIKKAREVGFNANSLDLIYGIPGMEFAQWGETLEQALALRPEHLSAYALTIEEKTVFGRWVGKGRMPPPDESLSSLQFERLVYTLMDHGYEHYEISNFCRPGHRAVHNSLYWSGGHYLGVGPGAHSFNGICRHANVRNNAIYIEGIKKGHAPQTEERLTPENRINEYIFTTLRTAEGCDLGQLNLAFGIDLAATHRDYIDRLASEGLATLDANKLRLTTRGKLLADSITVALMVDAGE